MSAAAAPYKLTAKEAKAVYAARRKGLYDCKDVYNEAWLSYLDMEADDVVFTMGGKGQAIPQGVFSVLNLRELLQQIRMWQAMGAKCLPVNIKEVKFGATSAWAFTVQPAGEAALGACGYSPLSLAFGTMVSGYTYVAKDRGTAELVVRALSK